MPVRSRMGIQSGRSCSARQRLVTGWVPLGTGLLLLAAGCGSGWETGGSGTSLSHVDFERDIAPLFEKHCIACHGASQTMNGLRLDRRDSALRGGYRGPAIIPGDASGSRLVRLISVGEDGIRMPPAGQGLNAQEIGLLSAWVDQGAEWPVASGAPSPEPDHESDHWAFQPVSRPPVPSVSASSAVRNPIDHFIIARLDAAGLRPPPAADRTTLVRRASLDLTGLPPTPAEVDAFLSDSEPGAYERLVDRLLNSPHYGERWAMPWLDLARYADSDGYEKDWERPYAWRWREWVIEALNRDMPFDQFTIEQLAGDVLRNARTEQVVATGFQRNTLKNREGGVKLEQFRFEETVDRTNTIGTVWLGLTLGCAQCHDHKYDPISQEEYYRFFAFMNGIEESETAAPVPGELEPYLQALPDYTGRRYHLLEEYGVYKLQAAWEARMLLAAEHPGRWTDWDHALDALRKMLDSGEAILRKAPEHRTPRERTKLEGHLVENYRRVISKQAAEELDWIGLYNKLRDLRNSTPDIAYARTVTDAPVPRETRIHLRGLWNRAGRVVEPGGMDVLPSIRLGGRHPRLALAEWLVSPRNPLTSRVTVNRVWQEYFGTGIVPTSDDFGTRSAGPTHPELLDWLAAEFVENGWSLKQLHRTIVSSATYRQSSEARPALAGLDPVNALLGRQRRIRLPAELIRDSALHASGLLVPKIGGPSVRPYQPEGVTDLAYADSVKWQASSGEDRYRRGLYTFYQRSTPHPQLVNFDIPDRNSAACSRERSNTPLQALNLLNDPVFVEAARALARRAGRVSNTDLDERLRYVFRRSVARVPSERELSHLGAYYRRQRAIFAQAADEAADFMPDRLGDADGAGVAALAGVASVAMNLDEFLTRE